MIAVGVLGLMAVPAPGQDGDGVLYTVDVKQESVQSRIIRDNKRHVSLQFQIKRVDDPKVFVTSVPKEEIVVLEDGRVVKIIDLLPPQSQDLTIILAMDISGSMARLNKIKAARDAALAFLRQMDDRADVGLILFDHEMVTTVPPARDPARQKAHREQLRKLIEGAQPRGGTAYLDAAVEGVKLLEGIKGRRAVVVMTDGVDMNSKATLEDAVNAARAADVPVYTVGIGNAGKNERVTTVLVLDRSGSMLGKANDKDERKKIDALKVAATRFVELMRPGARTLLQSFSSGIDPVVGGFTDDKKRLIAQIAALKAEGGTFLYDATFAGLETLEAGAPTGTRAVVVLTDGMDEAPGSKRSADAVVERARELGIKLYLLGLGREGEINTRVMREMAQKTGGEYYPARSEAELLRIFEDLSIRIHDDGIDEETLKKLAGRTGGRYFHIKDADLSELAGRFVGLADELQTTYRVTYESPRAAEDGTARAIDVKIVRDGRDVSKGGQAVNVVRAIAVPQLSYTVYLLFLLGLGALLVVPSALRKLTRPSAGA